MSLTVGAVTGFGAVGIATLASASPASATPTCTATWTGGAGTSDWGTALNWSPTAVPPNGADVCIPTNDTVVDASSAPSLGGLDVAQGASLTFGTPGGANGLGITVNGSATVEGSLVLGPAGTGFTNLTVDGAGLTVSSAGSVTDAGNDDDGKQWQHACRKQRRVVDTGHHGTDELRWRQLHVQ